MKPEDALKLVDSICSRVSLNRESHVQVQQAIQILTEAIKPKEEAKPKVEKSK